MKTGDTLDLYVAEIAAGYESFVSKQASNTANGNAGKNYTTEELANMVKRVKEKNAGNKNKK